jgi:hypothetical protein
MKINGGGSPFFLGGGSDSGSCACIGEVIVHGGDLLGVRRDLEWQGQE